jgi:7,8-dihydropterin-6-yl-methyl-4-(beta-D-ribofuranosyl)aminobenzene 5'-phosphate synthase
MSIKLIFLCDNRENPKTPNIKSEHGFSVLLETGGFALLIDSGTTDLFIKNAKEMGINLDDVKNALLTHGHGDHGGGLAYLTGKDIFMHKNAFQKRTRKPDIENNLPARDMTFTLANADKNNIWHIGENIKINENIYFLCNIPRKYEYEMHPFPATLENGADDMVSDEISVAIKTDKGLVVISGCAHCGICSTIDYAREICGEQRVYCVVGGFHLRKSTTQSIKTATAEWFAKNKVGRVIMGHCNCDDTIDLFKAKLGDKVTAIYAGLRVTV